MQYKASDSQQYEGVWKSSQLKYEGVPKQIMSFGQIVASELGHELF